MFEATFILCVVRARRWRGAGDCGLFRRSREMTLSWIAASLRDLRLARFLFGDPLHLRRAEERAFAACLRDRFLGTLTVLLFFRGLPLFTSYAPGVRRLRARRAVAFVTDAVRVADLPLLRLRVTAAFLAAIDRMARSSEADFFL